MTRALLRGIAQRRVRVALTVAAVAIGVALISGTYVLTDTINASFDRIFATAAKGTDVAVTPREAIGSSNGTQLTLPASLVDRVAKVPGVAKAQGAVFGPAAILGRDGKKLGLGGTPNFVSGLQEAPFEDFRFFAGRPPRGPSEVGLDAASAKRAGLRVGDTVQIVGNVPKRGYRITGLARFASSTSFGGTAVAIATLPTAQRIAGEEGRFDTIDVKGTPGTDPSALKRSVAAAVGRAATVRTAAEEADRQAQDIKDNLSFLRTALLAFAGISLFVGAFTIFNTFSITVAQRLREFALLRTLGASRGQVLRSVLAEGLVIGAIGAVVGLLAGLVLAPGLNALFKALGADFPNQGTVVATRTIVVALAVGIVVTLLSGLVPALRATRIPPVAALREGAVIPPGRGARLVTPLAVLLGVLGVAALAGGLFGGGGSGQALGLIGLGAGLVFLAVALLSPKLVPPLAAAVGLPLERTRGITGRLARENAVRQPGRTAITAAALMVAVALVSFATIFASGAKSSIDRAVDSAAVPGTLIVQSTDGFSPLSTGVARTLRSVPGVRSASPVVFSKGRARRIGDVSVSAVDPATFGAVYRPKLTAGSLRAIGADGAIVKKDFAEEHDLRVGSRLAVTTPTGRRVALTVRGVSDDQGGLLADLTIDAALARSAFGERRDALVFAGVAPADAPRVKRAVDRALKERFPTTEALTVDEFKADQAGQVDQLVTLIYVLLSLAVVVSLFGIVNTLVLSIYERTRELGMLRAIGTSRAQVRRTIRYEAVITSLIGAVLGLVLGVAFAVAIAQPLKDQGFVLSFPVATLVAVVVLSAVAGVVAAILPARRASRVDVLRALAYE